NIGFGAFEAHPDAFCWTMVCRMAAVDGRPSECLAMLPHECLQQPQHSHAHDDREHGALPPPGHGARHDGRDQLRVSGIDSKHAAGANTTAGTTIAVSIAAGT